MENVTFEVLPPPITWDEEKISKYCLDITHMLRQQNLYSVCIPEVVNESKDQDREVTYIPKIDNVHFAGLLKFHYHALVPILCKICVRLPKDEFIKWVDTIYEKGIRHVILVGGDREDIPYPGYTVTEGASIIKQLYPDMKLGGIAIFTRPKETQRMLDKMHAGIEFFISQIVFEAANLKQVTLNLSKICHHDNLTFPHIYLSIALASKVKDIEFMRWLGVEFPSAIYSYLHDEQEDTVEIRSQTSIDLMLDEIFHFIEKEKLDIGFNIEHVMYANLPISQKLFKNVKQRIAKI